MIPVEKQLGPPDSHHLVSAVGWLELGNVAEARRDFEKVSPLKRDFPIVISVEYEFCMLEKNWERCLEISRTLVEYLPHPDCPGWKNIATSLYRLGRMQEAYDAIAPRLKGYGNDPSAYYDAACIACGVGRKKKAMEWLKKAFSLGDRAKMKSQALNDADLKLLHDEIKKMS